MKTIGVGILAVLLVAGCGGSGRRGGGGDRDAGGTVDAGAGIDSGGGTDSGGADARSTSDAGPVCAPMVVMPYTTTPCSTATTTCIDGCTTGDCLDACLDADPSPMCRDCTNRALVSCFNRNGCQPQWDCYLGCTMSRCGGVPDPGACIEAMCLDVENAWYVCTEEMGPESPCLTRYVDCLPPA